MVQMNKKIIRINIHKSTKCRFKSIIRRNYNSNRYIATHKSLKQKKCVQDYIKPVFMSQSSKLHDRAAFLVVFETKKIFRFLIG